MKNPHDPQVVVSGQQTHQNLKKVKRSLSAAAASQLLLQGCSAAGRQIQQQPAQELQEAPAAQ